MGGTRPGRFTTVVAVSRSGSLGAARKMELNLINRRCLKQEDDEFLSLINKIFT